MPRRVLAPFDPSRIGVVPFEFGSGPFWFRRTTAGWDGIVYEKFMRTCDAQTMSKLRAFLADESGATAIEYGLIAAGIAVAVITVINGLGTTLNAKFTSIKTQLH